MLELISIDHLRVLAHQPSEMDPPIDREEPPLKKPTQEVSDSQSEEEEQPPMRLKRAIRMFERAVRGDNFSAQPLAHLQPRRVKKKKKTLSELQSVCNHNKPSDPIPIPPRKRDPTEASHDWPGHNHPRPGEEFFNPDFDNLSYRTAVVTERYKNSCSPNHQIESDEAPAAPGSDSDNVYRFERPRGIFRTDESLSELRGEPPEEGGLLMLDENNNNLNYAFANLNLVQNNNAIAAIVAEQDEAAGFDPAAATAEEEAALEELRRDAINRGVYKSSYL